MAKEGSRYDALIEKIFFDHYRKGESEFKFARTELESAAESLDIDLPKNLGDVIYSYRFRKDLPKPVTATQPDGMEWVIELARRTSGRGTPAHKDRNRCFAIRSNK